MLPDKELNNASQHVEWFVQIIPFLLAVALSCFGGIVNYLNRIDKSGVAFSFIRLIIEILTSGFVGIISFVLCSTANLEWSTTAAVVAISGHMGTRAIFLIETTAITFASNFLRTNGYESNSQTKTKRKKEADQDA